MEFLLSFLVLLPSVAILGLPAWALILYEPLETFTRIFSHANIRLSESTDRVLRLFISTPGFHRLHHSEDRREVDCNYGVVFSFWDRLFGTFASPRGRDLAGMPLGVVESRGDVQSFAWLLKDSFRF